MSVTIKKFGQNPTENCPLLLVDYDGEVNSDLRLRIGTNGADLEEPITRFAIYRVMDFGDKLVYDSLPSKAQLDWLDHAIQARGYTLDFGVTGRQVQLSSEDRGRLMRATVALDDALERYREDYKAAGKY